MSESPQSSEIDERLVNVEHFSDYKSRAEIEKEALPLADVEYENLTILDDEIFDEGDIVAALPHDEQDSYYDEPTEEIVKADVKFFDRLPITERRVFLCRYWYVESIETIANKDGFSQSKVKTMLYRTRVKLRRFFAEEVL